MNRVRAEDPLRRPSFKELSSCLGAQIPRDVFYFFKRGEELYLSYVPKGSYLVERKGEVTPGALLLLHRYAKRGIVEVRDEKRAMMFLYGRDLFKGSFKVITRPCKRGYVLVRWQDLLLGLGRLKREEVKNLLDLGEFLRRGY